MLIWSPAFLRNRNLLAGVLLLIVFSSRLLFAQSIHPTVRVGVLNFGTVNWELELIKRLELDAANEISIKVVPLGSKNATHVALQGRAVDIIVTDWVWVSRQRFAGRDYTFVPYSTSTGSVIINNDSDITSLADLEGVRFGVAGGPVDKSWILLSAYVRKALGRDLADTVIPNFAAPPLLNELFIRGEIDAVLNFWHYSARLQVLGNKTLINIHEILPALGVDRPLPMIGWVFSEKWAQSNPELIEQFIQTSANAKQLLADDDQSWEMIRSTMKVDSDEVYSTLISAYRQGIPGCFNQLDADSMSRAYAILAEFGGKKLIGDAIQLQPGTVWHTSLQKNCD